MANERVNGYSIMSGMPTVPAFCGVGILASVIALAQQPAELPAQVPPAVPGFSNEGQLLLAIITILGAGFSAWVNMRNNKIAADREAAKEKAETERREFDQREREQAREEMRARLISIEAAASSAVPSDVVKDIVKEKK